MKKWINCLTAISLIVLLTLLLALIVTLSALGVFAFLNTDPSQVDLPCGILVVIMFGAILYAILSFVGRQKE